MSVVDDRIAGPVRRYAIGRAILQIIDVLDQHSAVVAASAIAFDAFLSLVPLVAFAGLILTHLNESGVFLFGALFQAAPKPVADIVLSAVGRLSDADAPVVAPLSVLGFLWTTSAGISTAMGIFEKMFHSPPRSFWVRRAIAIGCVLVSIAVLAAATAIAVKVRWLPAPVGPILAWSVPGVTLLALLLGFFGISVREGTPHVSGLVTPIPVSTYRGRRRMWPGVVTTVLLWGAISTLFSYYVATIARYATLYGQLAAVAIFLLWLWFLALALLVGGEINAQLTGLRAPVPTLPDHQRDEAPRVDTA